MGDRLLRIEVDRTGRWRGNPPIAHQAPRPKGEPPTTARPIRGMLAAGEFLANPAVLPLPDAALSAIDCGDVFAYIRNDEGLVSECRRVLAPGGRLRLRVPATGPLAWLDAFNLARYLVDITRRGKRPYETTELGWRRHYPEDDLLALLGRDAFVVEGSRRSGLGLAELLTFAATVLFRWLRPDRARYHAARRRIAVVERLERRLAVPFGTTLELTLRRTESQGRKGDTA